MTWPELPPSYFVTTVAGATLLVDRGTGRSARLDAIAAVVIEHRESFADRDDAAAAMSELFERPQTEVAAGLATFDRDLAVVTQSAPSWEAPTFAPVQLPDSEPAATWTFDALGQSMHVTCHEAALVPIVTSILAAYPPSSGPVEHRFDIWDDGGIVVAQDGRLVYDRVSRPYGVAGLDALITVAATAEGDRRTRCSSTPPASWMRDGDAVVLTGRSNQGKSSTTVELLASGWSYLSDEVVRVELATRHVSGLPRPIGLEGPMRHRRPELRPDWIDAGDDDARWSVPPERLATVATGGHLAALIVLELRLDEPTRLDVAEPRRRRRPSSPAQLYDTGSARPDTDGTARTRPRRRPGRSTATTPALLTRRRRSSTGCVLDDRGAGVATGLRRRARRAARARPGRSRTRPTPSTSPHPARAVRPRARPGVARARRRLSSVAAVRDGRIELADEQRVAGSRTSTVEAWSTSCVWNGHSACWRVELDRSGITAVVLKGIALANTIYADPALRPTGDVDLFVGPDAIDDVLAVLFARSARRGRSPRCVPDTTAASARTYRCGSTALSSTSTPG